MVERKKLQLPEIDPLTWNAPSLPVSFFVTNPWGDLCSTPDLVGVGDLEKVT